MPPSSSGAGNDRSQPAGTAPPPFLLIEPPRAQNSTPQPGWLDPRLTCHRRQRGFTAVTEMRGPSTTLVSERGPHDFVRR